MSVLSFFASCLLTLGRFGSIVPVMSTPQIYVERAYPTYARWEIVRESPAHDGWVFARETTSGQVLSFAPGQLEPLPAFLSIPETELRADR